MSEESTRVVEEQGEVGTSREDLTSRLNYVPYHSWVSPEDHERDRVTIEKFLLDNGLASEEEIFDMKKQPLTHEEWQTIKDTPGHYWGKLFASRFPHKALRISGFQRFGYKQGYFHFMRQEVAWKDADREMWAQSHGGGDMPNNIKIEHMDQISPEFRIFYVLETIALGREVSYPWADQAWEGMKKQYVHQTSDPNDALNGVPLC